jgi:hypothetical protein
MGEAAVGQERSYAGGGYRDKLPGDAVRQSIVEGVFR